MKMKYETFRSTRLWINSDKKGEYPINSNKFYDEKDPYYIWRSIDEKDINFVMKTLGVWCIETETAFDCKNEPLGLEIIFINVLKK